VAPPWPKDPPAPPPAPAPAAAAAPKPPVDPYLDDPMKKELLTKAQYQKLKREQLRDGAINRNLADAATDENLPPIDVLKGELLDEKALDRQWMKESGDARQISAIPNVEETGYRLRRLFVPGAKGDVKFSELPDGTKKRIDQLTHRINMARENDYDRWIVEFQSRGYPDDVLHPDDIVDLMNRSPHRKKDLRKGKPR
jgi:hypothetical protein